MLRSDSSRPSRRTNSARLIRNEPITVAQPSRCANPLVRVPPASRITAAPRAGSAMISQSRENAPSAATGWITGTVCAPSSARRGRNEAVLVTDTPLVLQQAGVVDRGRPARPEDGHDDGESD